jgi:hypothetical protein
VRLYDLENDPEEMTNLAGRPEQRRRVGGLTRQLAEHMRRTARQPELVPQTDDVHAVLEHCLQPRDVTAGPLQRPPINGGPTRKTPVNGGATPPA